MKPETVSGIPPEAKENPYELPQQIDGQNIWSAEKRKETFRRKNKDIIPLLDEWNAQGCGSITSIGPVQQMIRQMPGTPEEKTAAAFAAYYAESAVRRDQELGIVKVGDKREIFKLECKYPNAFGQLEMAIRDNAGHTYKELGYQAKRMYDLQQLGMGKCCKPNQFSYEQIMNLYIARVFDSTVIGFQREVKTESWLNAALGSKGVTVRQASHDTDVNEGIDLELFYRGRLIEGIQVKGTNFNNREVQGEVENHARLTKQQKLYAARTGARVLMAFVREYRGQLVITNANEIMNRTNETIQYIDRKLDRNRVPVRGKTASVNRVRTETVQQYDPER